MKLWRKCVASATTLFMAVAVAPTAARASNVAGCLPDVGKRVPVVFVHGFHGDPDMWGAIGQKGKLIDTLYHVPELYVEKDYSPFNYREYHDLWVDNPNIGMAFAERIACMAQSSREQGGAGKVIVIAHSMGGLATRFAASQVLNGHKVADDLGLVVTLGTPNTGTLIADIGVALLRHLCVFAVTAVAGRPVSAPQDCLGLISAIPAMAATVQANVTSLPPLPKSVPVLAIAGDLSYTVDWFWPLQLSGSTGGDMFVSVASALAGANDPARGGGSLVIDCHTSIAIPFVTDASCWHGGLPQNEKVQHAITNAISQYLTSLSPSDHSQACETAAGQQCMWRISGDLDGDGKPDSGQLVFQANPRDIRAVLSLTKLGKQELSFGSAANDIAGASLLGGADVNGDGSAELYLAGATGGKSSWGKAGYKLYAVRLPGDHFGDDSSSYMNGVPLLKDFGAVIKGFACRRVGGKERLELSYGYNTASPSNQVTDRVYEAGTSGVMRHLFFETRGDRQTVIQTVGFHCAGLAVAPRAWLAVPQP